MVEDIYRVFEGILGVEAEVIQIEGNDYTPQSEKMFIMRGVAFYNNNSSSQTVTLKAGNTNIIANQIEPNRSSILNCENAILLSNEKLYIKGENISYRLWGVEINQ